MSGRGNERQTRDTGGWRIGAATVAFALLHSALASRGAKGLATRALGSRRRNGWYRAFFNVQGLLTSGALLSYVRSLPDRELYRVRGPAAGLMRAGQLAGVWLLFDGARRVGLSRLTGASSVRSFVGGETEVPPEPEAQGPRLDEDGSLKAEGAFLRSRHPLNLAAVPILWLNPRMTRNLAVFSAMATAYFWLGSIHEEQRLRAAYGEPYERYIRGRVPFFFGVSTLIQRELPASAATARAIVRSDTSISK